MDLYNIEQNRKTWKKDTRMGKTHMETITYSNCGLKAQSSLNKNI